MLIDTLPKKALFFLVKGITAKIPSNKVKSVETVLVINFYWQTHLI